MRKFYILFLSTLLMAGIANGQKSKAEGPPWKLGLSAGIDLPIGKFSDTHVLGLTINATLFKHIFDIPNTPSSRSIGFFFNAGIDYYIGMTETFSIYPYDYDEYTYFHLAPGLIYQTGRKTHLMFDLGPSISFPNGNTELGFLTNLGGYYFFNKHFAINPQVGLQKLSKADPLWSCSLRGTILF